MPRMPRMAPSSNPSRSNRRPPRTPSDLPPPSMHPSMHPPQTKRDLGRLVSLRALHLTRRSFRPPPTPPPLTCPCTTLARSRRRPSAQRMLRDHTLHSLPSLPPLRAQPHHLLSMCPSPSRQRRPSAPRGLRRRRLPSPLRPTHTLRHLLLLPHRRAHHPLQQHHLHRVPLPLQLQPPPHLPQSLAARIGCACCRLQWQLGVVWCPPCLRPLLVLLQVPSVAPLTLPSAPQRYPLGGAAGWIWVVVVAAVVAVVVVLVVVLGMVEMAALAQVTLLAVTRVLCSSPRCSCANALQVQVLL